MGKLSKALGFPPEVGDESAIEAEPDMTDTEEPVEAEAEGPGPAGVLAMKQFAKATDPAAKADAMYAFLQACGAC